MPVVLEEGEFQEGSQCGELGSRDVPKDLVLGDSIKSATDSHLEPYLEIIPCSINVFNLLSDSDIGHDIIGEAGLNSKSEADKKVLEVDVNSLLSFDGLLAANAFCHSILLHLLLLYIYGIRIEVGVELPTTEVRYRNLSVEARCKVVAGKPVPTLWSAMKGFLKKIVEEVERLLCWWKSDGMAKDGGRIKNG
ncbi:ABC transporter G family member 41 [Dendrobium catenatum]|uniref:ABC transporter G family member 41 n=1 Tax=Dendrobium catenatum TaxID=906689 RepID=A0A2I0VP18_9ASPA|nr:ABC transporter G family member 41 [Dendrobium catenatum]